MNEQMETLPILYRDEHLIAVHKPAGLLVHRSPIDRHETRFALQIVRNQIGQHVFPAHRLDKGTSGVLLFALDRERARDLGVQFENKTITKTYLAVVRGFLESEGRIDHPLTRQHDDYDGCARQEESEPAQSASTCYRRLATIDIPLCVDRYPSSRYALVELDPLTGRRHQLRRHLKHINHPIIGDSTYGKGRHNRAFGEWFDCRRMLLACVEMKCKHPVNGQEITLTAPLDGDFAKLMRKTGWSSALPARWLTAESEFSETNGERSKAE